MSFVQSLGLSFLPWRMQGWTLAFQFALQSSCSQGGCLRGHERAEFWVPYSHHNTPLTLFYVFHWSTA